MLLNLSIAGVVRWELIEVIHGKKAATNLFFNYSPKREDLSYKFFQESFNSFIQCGLRGTLHFDIFITL